LACLDMVNSYVIKSKLPNNGGYIVETVVYC